MNYDVIRAAYTIRMEKGYVFAGKMEEAKKQLDIFEDAKISETFLLEWEKEDYKVLRSILQEDSAEVEEQDLTYICQ